MNRILKTSCIIALSTFILTSCSGSNNGNSPTPTINASETASQITPTPSSSSSPDSSAESSATKNAIPGSVNTFAELYATERILDIKRASDRTYYNK